MIELTQWQLVGVVIGSIMLWQILLWIADRMDEIRVHMLFDRINSDLDVECNVRVCGKFFEFRIVGSDLSIFCDRDTINEDSIRDIGQKLKKIHNRLIKSS